MASALFVRPGRGTTVAVAQAPTAAAPQAAAPTPTPNTPPATPTVVTVDSETISGLGARNIGSAAMSGRIAAIDAVQEGNRITLYVGAASGGVWKSVNGGTTFKPVFDKQPVQSIGAIAIDPKNPKTVWVGTGESWTRNSVSYGDGIYKSTDGGDNWTNLGLPNSERITKIAIDPGDTNTVYACVPGKLWSDSDDRGVYKTADGGKSWNKVLKGLNASTGCSMMSFDRSNPKTIYAGLWDFRRKGWTFRSGGDGPNAPSGSALMKSTDGGATWTSLDDKSAPGLPSKPWGRVAVTVAPSNPNIVYAFVEAEPPKNALYRSDDGGKTWSKRDRSQFMIWRPFYFANLIVDPKNPDKLYKPDLVLVGSNDGGKSFSVVGGAAHGDCHDVWAHPQNPDHLIARVERQTPEVRGIKPLPSYKEGKLRFNWNTPMQVSPTGAVYLGSQFLFRTRDHGQTWERISPDLTTNNPEKQLQEQSGGVTVDNSSAEMNNTIYAVSESPKNKDVVWVGTDDGNVQLTRDGGKTWTNLTKNLPLAPNAWISYVEAGHFDEGTAFVTVDMHTTGDMTPYAYKTTDFGKTWTPLIAGNSGVNGYAHVVREDLVNPHLLYAGTEHGLWISLDDGKQWAQYKGGDMPVGVAVRDIAIHPRDNDLVLATHGRGIWIVDDITPLRALTPDVMAKEAEFLQSTPAVQRIFGQGGWVPGDAQFVGNNPPADAVITYYQKKRHIFGDLKIDVLDSAGNVVGTIPSSKRRGL